MVFSEKEEALVKESWEVLKLNIPKFSLRFFTLILEIEPETRSLFTFVKETDDITTHNPLLRAHSIKIFKMVCESAIQLREKGEVAMPDSTLESLASLHLRRGVLDSHFEVVKEALFQTVKEAMEQKWCDDMEAAWGVAYDQLATKIKDVTRAQAAQLN